MSPSPWARAPILVALVPPPGSLCAGDAYMAASGHDGSSDHCERLFRMACSMIQCMERFQYDSKEVQVMKSKHLEIRVGLHTGPVYAGVVGRKCPRCATPPPPSTPLPPPQP